MSEWQPIETAPKDTQILLRAPDFECPADTDRQYLCCVVQGWFETGINDQRW